MPHSLNPNHSVVQAADGQWHKILFVVMCKLGVERVEITEQDIAAAIGNGDRAVVLDARNGKLAVWLATREEAESLARKEGGLPT